MDEDLGDFFSEIEKVEQVVSSTENESTALSVGVESVPSTTVDTPLHEDRVVSAPQVVQKSAAIEIKTVKAAPNLTYAADYNSNTSSRLENPTTSSSTTTTSSGSSNPSIYDPPGTHTHSHHTHTSITSTAPKFTPPLPPMPYGSTPLIMTGAQMQAAQQPAIPQPAISKQDKKFVRSGAGEVWVDDTLNEWPANDFRLFVGDLGNEVTTEMLAKEYQKYKTFAKAKVVRGGWNNKSKGYGFVSFIDPFDCAKALREMNGKYIGNRPMKLRKSTWKDNDINEVKKKDKKKEKDCR